MPGEHVKLFFIRLGPFLFFIILAGIIYLVYANALYTPFQSDDERHIYGVPQIGNLDHYTNLSNIGYRHINNLSFALNYKWGKENPFGYHIFNVLIHICTTLLIFNITRLTIAKGTSFGEGAALKIALITAFIFGLHPLQTETVTYISGRPGGLAGFFYFASILLFINGSLKNITTSQLVFYIFSLISFCFAILSKEIAITLPAIIILYDIYFMKGSNWCSIRSRLGFYLCYPALGGVAFYLSPSVFKAIEGFFGQMNFTLGLVQLDILKHPLKLFLFPINLTFEYDFLTHVSWSSLFGSFAIIFLCLFLTIKKFYIRNSILTFCVLWFPLTIAPTNSFMPRTHLFSERNMYIPSFGLSLFFGVILYLILFNKKSNRRFILAMIILITIGILYSTQIVKRNQAYASPSALWADTFKKSPHKLSIGKTLSIHYLMEEDYASAVALLEALLRVNPNLYDVRQNLGIAKKSLGDFSSAEKHFKESIRIEPTDPAAHFNLASLYGNLGKFVDASREFDQADTLYKNRGKYPPQQFYFDKARAHNQAGIQLIQAQNFEGALIQLEKSVEQDPNLLSARFNLAKLLLEYKNDRQGAKRHLNASINLHPNPQQSQIIKKLLTQTEEIKTLK